MGEEPQAGETRYRLGRERHSADGVQEGKQVFPAVRGMDSIAA